jgi:hypothetical protein
MKRLFLHQTSAVIPGTSLQGNGSKLLTPELDVRGGMKLPFFCLNDWNWQPFAGHALRACPSVALSAHSLLGMRGVSQSRVYGFPRKQGCANNYALTFHCRGRLTPPLNFDVRAA